MLFLSEERCPVFRLKYPIPLDSLDCFIQSLRCPEVLQNPIAVFGISISYQSQDGGIVCESLSICHLARYAYSGRKLAAPLFQDAGATGWALAIALSDISRG
jgi:hypothetical protein